jgi:electron transport complex protein RnfB
MDFQNIIIAGISLGGMGLLFGAGLAYASQKFAVEIDPRALAIRDALPAANCGGCGYPGCDAFANAIVAGLAPINGCPVGGAECTAKLAAIMGMEASTDAKQVAYVLCKGGTEQARLTYDYSGITDCRAAHMLYGGDKACRFGCLGYGTCERACPFDAIHMTSNGIAEVDPEKCVACGLCIEACPKDVIAYVPYGQDVIVDCNNQEKGGHVKKDCSVACIACGICEKKCPFDAIHVENNIARIDYSKCTSCMVCVEKCPTKAIKGDLTQRKKAVIIEEKCIGCTICAKKCPVQAITGELKALHHVNTDMCIGCGVCEAKCPKDAIEMKKL